MVDFIKKAVAWVKAFIKGFPGNVWAYIKSIKLRGWMLTALYAFLVYIHFLGFLGVVGLTVVFILLNKKIDSI